MSELDLNKLVKRSLTDMERSFSYDNGESGSEDSGPGRTNLLQQNMELRRQLEDEQASYKRRLNAYQEGQQRQAQLVQKLQAKVLQYKKKCSDLEARCALLEGDLCRARKTASDTYEADAQELENALVKLEEEQQRASSLSHVNNMLRDQLDQATAANQNLSSTPSKITEECNRTRDNLDKREAD